MSTKATRNLLHTRKVFVPGKPWTMATTTWSRGSSHPRSTVSPLRMESFCWNPDVAIGLARRDAVLGLTRLGAEQPTEVQLGARIEDGRFEPLLFFFRFTCFSNLGISFFHRGLQYVHSFNGGMLFARAASRPKRLRYSYNRRDCRPSPCGRAPPAVPRRSERLRAPAKSPISGVATVPLGRLQPGRQSAPAWVGCRSDMR